MQKFKFELNHKTNMVTKTLDKTFNHLDVLNNGIKNGKNSFKILEQYKDALIGQKEKPIIRIELEWFHLQQNIQNIEKEIKDIMIALNGVEEAIDPLTKEVITEAVPPLEDEKLIEEYNKTLEELNDYETTLFNDEGVQETQQHLGILNQAISDRNSLEEKNPWLTEYRTSQEDGFVYSRPTFTEDDIQITSIVKKQLIANARNTEIRSLEDSVADIAKMNSLTFSVISSLWELVPDESKDSLPEEKRGLIDYAVNKFDNIQTRADRQMSKEGTSLVDKLYDREIKIADLIDKINS